MWNSLPEHVVLSTTAGLFRSNLNRVNLDKFLLHNQNFCLSFICFLRFFGAGVSALRLSVLQNTLAVS